MNNQTLANHLGVRVGYKGFQPVYAFACPTREDGLENHLGVRVGYYQGRPVYAFSSCLPAFFQTLATRVGYREFKPAYAFERDCCEVPPPGPGSGSSPSHNSQISPQPSSSSTQPISYADCLGVQFPTQLNLALTITGEAEGVDCSCLNLDFVLNKSCVSCDGSIDCDGDPCPFGPCEWSGSLQGVLDCVSGGPEDGICVVFGISQDSLTGFYNSYLYWCIEGPTFGIGDFDPETCIENASGNDCETSWTLSAGSTFAPMAFTFTGDFFSGGCDGTAVISGPTWYNTICCAGIVPNTLHLTLSGGTTCACLNGTYVLNFNPICIVDGEPYGGCWFTDDAAFDTCDCNVDAPGPTLLSLQCGGSQWTLTLTCNQGTGTWTADVDEDGNCSPFELSGMLEFNEPTGPYTCNTDTLNFVVTE